jgi:hypothetical protein
MVRGNTPYLIGTPEGETGRETATDAITTVAAGLAPDEHRYTKSQ